MQFTPSQPNPMQKERKQNQKQNKRTKKEEEVLKKYE